MVKSVLAETHVESYINSCIQDGCSTVGLIIGKATKSKDYVVKLIQTPFKEADNKQSGIHPLWVSGHAAEILPMVPSGLHIIGVYAVGDFGKSDLQADLRKCVFSVHSKLNSSPIAKHVSEARFSGSCLWTILHVDSRTKRVSLCKQYDVTDSASSARPAEWKYQTCPTKWSSVNAKVKVCCNVCPKSKSTTDQIIHQIVETQSDMINSAVVMFDGVLKPSTEILDNDKSSSSSSKHKDKKNKSNHALKADPASKWGKKFQCSVYLPTEEHDGGDSATLSCDETDACVSLEGILDIHAYLPVKTTVQDAVVMLKAAIIQDFYQRCQLLKEDLAEQKGPLANNGVIPMPKKVLFTDPATPDGFLWCQFMFPEESLDDLVEIIKDSCKMTVDKDDINRNGEQFSDAIDEGRIHNDASNPSPSTDESSDDTETPAEATRTAVRPPEPLFDKSSRLVTVAISVLALLFALLQNIFTSTPADTEPDPEKGP